MSWTAWRRASDTGSAWTVPSIPTAGLRCNPQKLLVDPYARAIDGEVTYSAAAYGHDLADRNRPSALDSAGVMPRSVMVQEVPPVGPDDRGGLPVGVSRPNRHLSDTVFYEVHVKGVTQRHPDVPPEIRGTYAGLAHPAVLDRLVALGVTAVELLPVHHHVPEAFLLERGLTNYWGYNSIGYLAPFAGYSAAARAGRRGGEVAEFRSMVTALHEAGLEVVLDVVYNHTAEAGEGGPTISLRGLDNQSYYRLDPNAPRHYVDTSGCGNGLNVGNPACLRLIMDSLRYWVSDMGVDGFRFDLAPALARQHGGFDDVSAFFDLVWQDPVISQVKLIAEPWDVGQSDSYDVGRFPPGWSEWNGAYRDTVRDFWRSHEGVLPQFATRLGGSPDLYTRHGRGPDASVNLVTVHDGFTLADMVSYNGKHNEANGEDNRDGTNENRSWNCGVEGPTADPAILELRDRQCRAMLATVLLSRGVPLLLGGDELGRTQGGNNNGYCQDNEISWWDWSLSGAALEPFVAQLIALRHAQPALRRRRYPEHPEAERWFTPGGEPMTDRDWADSGAKSVALVLSGSVDPDIGDDGTPQIGDDVALLINAWWEPLAFALTWSSGGPWIVAADSYDPGRRGAMTEQTLVVGPRSLVAVRTVDADWNEPSAAPMS